MDCSRQVCIHFSISQGGNLGATMHPNLRCKPALCLGRGLSNLVLKCLNKKKVWINFISRPLKGRVSNTWSKLNIWTQIYSSSRVFHMDLCLWTANHWRLAAHFAIIAMFYSFSSSLNTCYKPLLKTVHWIREPFNLTLSCAQNTKTSLGFAQLSCPLY